MRSATRSSATPRRSSRRTAARCWARCAIRSRAPTSPRSCCRRRPPRRKIIGLANAGGDTTNSIKQAAEFGIVKGGQSLAGLLVFITDVQALGLQTAQGLIFTEAWYWDQNDANREFAKKFAERNKGVYPTMIHAGVYSAVTHYLKAVAALKSDADGKAVVAKMKEMPTDDHAVRQGHDPRRRPQDPRHVSCSR